jgi:hypothetical protein
MSISRSVSGHPVATGIGVVTNATMRKSKPGDPPTDLQYGRYEYSYRHPVEMTQLGRPFKCFTKFRVSERLAVSTYSSTVCEYASLPVARAANKSVGRTSAVVGGCGE